MSARAAKAAHLLYVSNTATSLIDVFDVTGANATLVGQITDANSPSGMATDGAGNLYVADAGFKLEDGHTVGMDVRVFPKGQTVPSRILNPGKWVPYDVCVGAYGTIYAANIANANAVTPGSVSVYAPGATWPSRTLTFANFQVLGVLVDNHTNDLYVNYDTGSFTNVIQFPHANPPGKVLDMHTTHAWGITEDSVDRLALFDGPSNAIDVFGEDAQNASRVLHSTTPDYGAFNNLGDILYVTDFNDFNVDVIAYPSGKRLGTITQPDWNAAAWPIGVAVWPPATF